MTLSATDPRHGTKNGYANHGCRCDRCRAAQRDAGRGRYRRLNTTPLEKRRGRPLRERLYERISIRDDTDCWLWTGTLNERGYGHISVEGRILGAYRAVYEWFIGPVPGDLELDHLCRNPTCVNPAHLEPVTHAENMARGANALKTHCANGHPFDEDNTYYNPKRNNWRTCRTCRTQRQRRIYARNRTRTGPLLKKRPRTRPDE